MQSFEYLFSVLFAYQDWYKIIHGGQRFDELVFHVLKEARNAFQARENNFIWNLVGKEDWNKKELTPKMPNF